MAPRWSAESPLISRSTPTIASIRRTCLDRQLRFGDIGEHEELASAMGPARGLDDRARFSRRMIQVIKPGLGVALKDAGVVLQMAAGMLAAAIARVEEDHAGGRVAPEWWLAAKTSNRYDQDRDAASAPSNQPSFSVCVGRNRTFRNTMPELVRFFATVRCKLSENHFSLPGISPCPPAHSLQSA